MFTSLLSQPHSLGLDVVKLVSYCQSCRCFDIACLSLSSSLTNLRPIYLNSTSTSSSPGLGARQGGHCDMPPRGWLSQNEAFSPVKRFRRLSRMGRWSFWSWFDVNRATFEEDMREKRFLHFRYRWHWPLTFRPHICSPIVTIVRRYVSTKLEVSTAFLFRENRRQWRTDGQTGGV